MPDIHVGDEMDKYTQKDIVKATGMSASVINFYVHEGVVVPAIKKGEGRGHVSIYSVYNKFQFLIISRLNRLGVNVGTIKKIVTQVDNMPMMTKEGVLLRRKSPYVSIGDDDACVVINVASLAKKL